MTDRERGSNDYRYGANVVSAAGTSAPARTRFRLWAPTAKMVEVELEGAGRSQMSADSDGWFEIELPCGGGAAYRYVAMTQFEGEVNVPDPASRAQRGDIDGPSLVVDHDAYVWQNPQWRGRPWHETVLYELHAGLLGGFDGVRARLPALAALGITAVELMPVADFPSDRNWGYDGVLPFAPDASYGTPDQLKALIDAAHGLGMMVFLDVVYNHFGPDGNYLNSYALPFFRDDLHTPWGKAIDFRRREVRDFFTENALYWLREYRFDGLRLDAVHAISEEDWLTELARRVRETMAAEQPGRHVHLVLENDHNRAALLRDGAESHGHAQDRFDAQWNDDWHHVMHVLLTGEQAGYYEDYAQDCAGKLARSLMQGFIYQGEASVSRDGRRRGEPSAHLPQTAFVNFLQNHDQTGNRAFGERLTVLANPHALRVAQALLLLSPHIPLLFMGEEYGSRQPFLYFTSHRDHSLASAVRDGRRKEFARFPEFADAEARTRIPDPNQEATYRASMPEAGTDVEEPDGFAWREWTAALLKLRRAHIAPRLRGSSALGASAIGPAAVCARWRLGDGAALGIVVNLGETDVPAALDAVLAPAGADVLFDSGGVLQALERGVLPAWAMLAVLEPALESVLESAP
ncbi:malto-oligosyltrehalose trehalohydrolase [Oxalobacteraceae bacterium CAVE-383]|nr:malto-oligosyltrehalose trehalohydrolase [Oxalobacteraceae bacterium CAVE-383]